MKKVKPPNSEPDLLIESMQKLIDHMNDNKTHQEEIFQSLNATDVFKILQNFDDSNSSMRKTSAAFLCELVYDNPGIQKGFCDIANILPIEGKICVNRIPNNLLSQSKSLPLIFEAIKNAPIPLDNDGNFPLCWYYELQRDKNHKQGIKYIRFEKTPQSAKQRIQHFIDPQSYLFGFVIATKKNITQQFQQQQQPTPYEQIVQNRTQASRSQYEPKRTPIQKKARPLSGSNQSPLASVSPNIKKPRNLNVSLDFDASGIKTSHTKPLVEYDQFTIVEEQIVKPRPRIESKKPQTSVMKQRMK